MKNKKFILAAMFFVLVLSFTAHAIYKAPKSIPAEIKKIQYITGLPEIDGRKYGQQEQYKGWFELKKDDATFYRKRIKQGGGKGLESVEVVKVPYKSIKELYFGYDAIVKAASGTLPTALSKIYNRGGSYFSGETMYQPLPEFLRKKKRSPVIIFFKRNGKTVSLVFLAGNKRAQALYELLGKGSGIKLKEPRTILDIKS